MSNVEITIDFKDAEGNPSSPEYFNSLPDWKSKLDRFVRENEAEVITTSDKMTLIIPYYYMDSPDLVRQQVLEKFDFIPRTADIVVGDEFQRRRVKSSGVNWEVIEPNLEISVLVNAVRRISNTSSGKNSASVIGNILLDCGYFITKQAYAIDYHNSGQLEQNGFVWISPEDYEPQTGDIAVFERNGTLSTGHIQVFDGRNWVSDYRQPDFFPSGMQGVSYHLYRDADVVGEVVNEGALFDFGSDGGSVLKTKDPRPPHADKDVGYFPDGRGYFSWKAYDATKIKHFAFYEIKTKFLKHWQTKTACTDGYGCVCESIIPALEAMVSASNGKLVVNSSFRSVQSQATTFKRRADRDGIKRAYETAAPPGYSEHSTGLAIDFNRNYINTRDPIQYERNSPSWPFLRDNAWRFGFQQSFKRAPKNPIYGNRDTSIDGVAVEGWHWIFVGTDITARGKPEAKNFPADWLVKTLRKPVGATSKSPRW